ncbi:uncharacterized protein OCT59_024476 [Rhizophagus irregularis]|nr:hypothetical protein OCT59_024476 [Rhizophagus irregularis]
MRESLNDKIIKQMINHQVEIVEEALLVNEYNLIWNKKIITGGFRNWKKKVTNVIWKNEILNSEKLDDLFMYNFRNGCIKNLLKEQPTYGTLFKRNKRNTNKIENEECKRCGKNEKETWEHIWLCEDNEITIDEIVQEAIYKFEKSLDDTTDINDTTITTERNYNFDFIRILEHPSII